MYFFDFDAFAGSTVELRYSVTESELAAAFTESDRRFREEPERFESEAARLLRGTPETYGESCAPYLVSILNEGWGYSASAAPAVQPAADVAAEEPVMLEAVAAPTVDVHVHIHQ